MRGDCKHCKRQDIFVDADSLCCVCREEIQFAQQLIDDPRALAIQLRAKVQEQEKELDDANSYFMELQDY